MPRDCKEGDRVFASCDIELAGTILPPPAYSILPPLALFPGALPEQFAVDEVTVYAY
jgi:hypothetical protein